MTALVPTHQAPLAVPEAPVLRPEDAERVFKYAEANKAENTRKAYQKAWDRFARWCAEHPNKLTPLPAHPLTVAAYLSELADEGYAWSTLNVVLSAIDFPHKMQRLPVTRRTPEVATVIGGIRRTIDLSPDQSTPFLAEHVKKALPLFAKTLRGCRDRALLAVAWAGAFRRSEITALNLSDLTRVGDEYKIRLRVSKTDQEGHGRWVGLPKSKNPETCPVTLLDAWIEASKAVAGPDRPLFLVVEGPRGNLLREERIDARALSRLVVRAAALAEIPGEFSAHSLRAGFVTSALAAGVEAHKIMEQTGHRNYDTLRIYYREPDPLVAAPGRGLL